MPEFGLQKTQARTHWVKDQGQFHRQALQLSTYSCPARILLHDPPGMQELGLQNLPLAASDCPAFAHIHSPKQVRAISASHLDPFEVLA